VLHTLEPELPGHDYSREVAICLGIGAKCVNSSAFSGDLFLFNSRFDAGKHSYDNAVNQDL